MSNNLSSNLKLFLKLVFFFLQQSDFFPQILRVCRVPDASARIQSLLLSVVACSRSAVPPAVQIKVETLTARASIKVIEKQHRKISFESGEGERQNKEEGKRRERDKQMKLKEIERKRENIEKGKQILEYYKLFTIPTFNRILAFQEECGSERARDTVALTPTLS